MSLYAGLIPTEAANSSAEDDKTKDSESSKSGAGSATGWLASKQLMNPALLRKRQQANAAASAAQKPVNRTAILASAPMVPATHTVSDGQEPFYHAEFSLVPVENEYDPFRPNDYETFVEDREERKRRKKEEEEAEKRRRRERKEGRHESRSSSDFAPPAHAIPPPESQPANINLNESAAEAIARRMRMSGKAPPAAAAPAPQQRGGESYGARLLGQMGWKEGSGLGKQEQGMATPLIMEKTGKQKGVIVPSASISTNVMAKATRVVLLENMVGPGEVDDDLQPEVAEECSKYGKVVKCLIFEVPGGQVPDDQAVRIFVEFDRIDSARKALLGLNNRFFGGRTVRANFFDEGKFSRFDLAPQL